MTLTERIPGVAVLAAIALSPLTSAVAQSGGVDFDGPLFVKTGSRVVEHLGVRSLRGGGTLTEPLLADGTIDVDLTMDGSRAFVGVAFRMRAEGEAEWFYLRPHRSGTPVALQYTPVFNGLDAWQLYTGPGFTGTAEIPSRRWVHLRLEFAGSQARAFLDGSDRPVLVMHDLKRPAGPGMVALIGPATGQVHFANLRVSGTPPAPFPQAPPLAVAPGALTRWELSQVVPVRRIARLRHPGAQQVPLRWTEVESEPTGLVNVSRWVPRSGALPETVFARAIVREERARAARLHFGYSDEVTVFLNGRPVFSGDASFQSRDSQFYGAVGLHDSVILDLHGGDNELLLAVTENFGGWGFMARLAPDAGDPVARHAALSPVWETAGFNTPESVAFDPARGVFYVSNLGGPAGAGGFVSRLAADGTRVESTWVTGLKGPAGLAVRGNRLFAVERDALAEIDADTRAIVARHPLPGAAFPNDVAVAPDGGVFVSDSATASIYRLANGTVEVFIRGEEIAKPNGLLADGGRLVVATNGDGCLKEIDLATRRVTPIMRFGPGILDGVRSDGRGGLLVSQWEGVVWHLRADGRVEVLLDSRPAALAAADFEFVPAAALLVVPTYLAGEVHAYTLAPGT